MCFVKLQKGNSDYILILWLSWLLLTMRHFSLHSGFVASALFTFLKNAALSMHTDPHDPGDPVMSKNWNPALHSAL